MTEVVRRCLLKSVRDSGEGSQPDTFKRHTVHIYRMLPKKEKEHRDIAALNTFWVREVFRKCPAVLGKFDADSDSLAVVLPKDGARLFWGWKQELMCFFDYPNTV
jgi:hypothetical protein